MKWMDDADQAISRVPFFVRRRVRKRVEEEAVRSNSSVVTMEHVERCHRRFLNDMENEVKGYQVEACFGTGGCPNKVVESDGLTRTLEDQLQRADIKGFLKTVVKGPLKMHHEFRIALADCPNACSRPQIADIGIIAAMRPGLSEEKCTQCRACKDVCREQAVFLTEGAEHPVIDYVKCVLCGQCVQACPTSTLVTQQIGYRIQLGGKLGRHPQLGREIPGIYSEPQVIGIVEACLGHLKQNSRKGERFGEILNRTGLQFFNNEVG